MNNMYDILAKINLLEGKGSKPDFLDLDKDGNRDEPMKKAAKEVDEAMQEPRHPQELDYQAGPEDDEQYRAHHGLDDPDRQRERKLRATDYKTLDRLERQAMARAKQIDEEPNEGNEFSGELAKAKASGQKEFKVDGKTYPVKESRPQGLVLVREAATDTRSVKIYHDQAYDEFTVCLHRDGTVKRVFAEHRAQAMKLAREWLAEGRNDPSPLDDPLTRFRKKHAPSVMRDPKAREELSKLDTEYGERKKTGYGRGEDEDEDDEEGTKKAKPAGEKRGRGRPKGTKRSIGAKGPTGRSKLLKKGAIGEDYDKDEYDEEGEMAQSQARTIKDAAEELQSILDANENLPEWVQKKITLAKEYIDSARDYLKANRPEDDGGEMSLPEAADGGFTQDDYDKIARKKRHLMMLNRNLEPEDAEEMAAHKLGYDYDEVLAWVNADHDQVKEGSTGDYSAKKARAGKDIGKPGKQFAKIAKSAGERYGSKERGEKVAGAVLAKLRAKESAGEELEEKAVSKAQRAAAGIAYAAKKGDIPKSELRGASKEMAKMKGSELKKFAKTKEKGLPEKKKEESVEETTTSGSVATAPADSGTKSKSKGGIQFGKGIYENQLQESFDAKLKQVLNEGTTITINDPDSGEPSVSVNATGKDAAGLGELLKLAGMFSSSGYTRIDDQDTCSECGGAGMHEAGCSGRVMEEDLANSANNTETMDVDYMTQELAGGLNGPKLQSNPNNMGDNPLAMQNLGAKASPNLNLGAVAEEIRQERENHLIELYKRIA